MSDRLVGMPAEPVQDYVVAWSEGIRQVLGQIANATFQAGVTYAPAGSPLPDPQAGVWLRFKASQRLAGDQAFWVAASEAGRLAGLLLGETPVPDTPLSPEQRDALGELFRQFACSVALDLRGKLGGEVDLRLLGNEPPDFPESTCAEICVQGGEFPPFTITLRVGSTLAASLAPGPPAAQQPGVSTPACNLTSEASVVREPNLDLLLDIELETTLRFGARSMVLRDVLELGPGAIIELDRQIDDPVELLVGNRVIARGEVVVVDGNYGLRVMEMASRQERIDSIGG